MTVDQADVKSREISNGIVAEQRPIENPRRKKQQAQVRPAHVFIFVLQVLIDVKKIRGRFWFACTHLASPRSLQLPLLHFDSYSAREQFCSDHSPCACAASHLLKMLLVGGRSYVCCACRPTAALHRSSQSRAMNAAADEDGMI